MSRPPRGLDASTCAPETVGRMADAARRWLDVLDPSQRACACFRFEDGERYVWHYRPVTHRGLPLRDMSAAQCERATALLDAGLSARGAAEVRAIMALETVLGELERQAGRDNWSRRNPALYWFAIFGDPGGRAPWAWRVGGHHVAVHVTVVESHVAVTPLFLGANPVTVPHGAHASRRTLAAEEELAREFLGRLNAEQKAVAIVDAVAPADILTRNYRVADPGAPPHGIAYERLAGEQREALARLMRHYVERAAPEVAAVKWNRIETAELQAVTFAWAGPEARGHGHYYAVRGSRFLIEYDNTQNGANHIHSVWRDFANDWGEDLLAAHYATAHAQT